jgi:hypothetical protein
MTQTSLVRRSDLKRLASIAKSEGVSVSIDVGGTIITVSPNIHNDPQEDRVAKGKGIRL